METLTLVRAKEIAAEVVAEFGEDYVYPEEHKAQCINSEEPACMYVHDGKPSCLVAQILVRFGVPVSLLMFWENRGAYVVSQEVTECEDQVASFLSVLQGRQDGGVSWGEALKVANRFYPN